MGGMMHSPNLLVDPHLTRQLVQTIGDFDAARGAQVELVGADVVVTLRFEGHEVGFTIPIVLLLHAVGTQNRQHES